MLRSWWSRLKARQRLGRVGIWYHPGYAPLSLMRTARAAHVFVRRGELVLGEMARRKLLRPADVRPAPAARTADLELVHPRHYLERLQDPEVLSGIFAMQPGEIDVEEILTSQRLQVGGTIEAARAVVTGERAVALNLGGGLHHAGPERGAGFCAYNDIAVAIARVRAEGLTEPIAIVDLDYHQGDGNLAIFAEDDSVLTFSIHGSVWSHLHAENDVGILLDAGTDDSAYWEALSEELPEALEAHDPGLVFLIAGNDVLAGDDLGDFELTPSGVLARDRLVVSLCADRGTPLVIVLGGGYSVQAWQTSASLLLWLLTGLEEVPASPEAQLRAHFEQIARRLDPVALEGRAASDFSFTEEELLEGLVPGKPARRLLGHFTVGGVRYLFQQFGILRALGRRGFVDLHVSVDPSDPHEQRVRVHGTKGRERYLLIELVVRRLQRQGFELLSIEWLRLQDPTTSFSLARPQLPGQDHPGLGLSAPMLEMLVQVTERIGLDGLLQHPSAYHIAVGSRGWQFLDPEVEGRNRALQAVLEERDILEATQLVTEGRLVTADGTPVPWEPTDLVLPVTPRMKAALEDPDYRARAEAERARLAAAGLHVAAEGESSRPTT